MTLTEIWRYGVRSVALTVTLWCYVLAVLALYLRLSANEILQ